MTAAISAHTVPLASLTNLSELSSGAVAAVVVCVILLWFAVPLLAAAYGWGKGYPFFPLFAAQLVMPIFGTGLVLLAVAVAGERPVAAVSRASAAKPRR